MHTYAGPASTRVALRSRGVFTIFARARFCEATPLFTGARRPVVGGEEGRPPRIGRGSGRVVGTGGERVGMEEEEEWGAPVRARRGARIPGGESPGDVHASLTRREGEKVDPADAPRGGSINRHPRPPFPLSLLFLARVSIRFVPPNMRHEFFRTSWQHSFEIDIYIYDIYICFERKFLRLGIIKKEGKEKFDIWDGFFSIFLLSIHSR